MCTQKCEDCHSIPLPCNVTSRSSESCDRLSTRLVVPHDCWSSRVSCRCRYWTHLDAMTPNTTTDRGMVRSKSTREATMDNELVRVLPCAATAKAKRLPSNSMSSCSSFISGIRLTTCSFVHESSILDTAKEIAREGRRVLSWRTTPALDRTIATPMSPDYGRGSKSAGTAETTASYIDALLCVISKFSRHLISKRAAATPLTESLGSD